MKFEIRALRNDDFAHLMQLERDLFGDDEHGTLGPYYVRLCCDFFNESCFIALADDRAIGYVLSFVRDGECYCTTLGVLPEFQRSRATGLLLRAFVSAIVPRCNTCWFTVKEDNHAARALHKTLGAVDVEVRPNFYGPGDERIVSRIDSNRFEELRARYERLGLVQRRPQPVATQAS